MTLTKQQTDQINSINPEILKLSEEVLEEIKVYGKEMVSVKIFVYDRQVAKLSGILSQCKGELEFLLKRVYEKGKNVKERISALKVAIKYMGGILK